MPSQYLSNRYVSFIRLVRLLGRLFGDAYSCEVSSWLQNKCSRNTENFKIHDEQFILSIPRLLTKEEISYCEEESSASEVDEIVDPVDTQSQDSFSKIEIPASKFWDARALRVDLKNNKIHLPPTTVAPSSSFSDVYAVEVSVVSHKACQMLYPVHIYCSNYCRIPLLKLLQSKSSNQRLMHSGSLKPNLEP
jgi:hypothetical protein